MFPTPIAKQSRSRQLTYQTLLPVALILWLLPLIAVALFLSLIHISEPTRRS